MGGIPPQPALWENLNFWILFWFSLVKNVNKLVGTEINNSVFLTLL